MLNFVCSSCAYDESSIYDEPFQWSHQKNNFSKWSRTFMAPSNQVACAKYSNSGASSADVMWCILVLTTISVLTEGQGLEESSFWAPPFSMSSLALKDGICVAECRATAGRFQLSFRNRKKSEACLSSVCVCVCMWTPGQGGRAVMEKTCVFPDLKTVPKREWSRAGFSQKRPSLCMRERIWLDTPTFPTLPCSVFHLQLWQRWDPSEQRCNLWRRIRGLQPPTF